MYYLFVLLAVLLVSALVLSTVKYGRFIIWAKAFRITVVSLSLVVFALLFIRKSVSQFQKNSLTVQVVNKLPFPIDFYMVKINSGADPDDKYEARHIGSIRSNYYRIEYIDMKNSDEFWIAGLMGKKDLVYFSQHSVPNKNQDQIIEVRNYIKQSIKLADIAKTQITAMKFENMKTAIWITLDFLLLFLNIVLLVRKSTKKSQPEPGFITVKN
ncbi:hypothetical protein [Kaistella palustris]|uniref:hypothetical protein n=1 Tax=Kaistella palustris TaxID=493376 RepID=UPI0003FFACAE|nr:hypothetical protein [Kaistella palustris]